MKTGKNPSAFHLPYNQSSHCWIAIFPLTENAALRANFLSQGMKAIDGGGFAVRYAHPWNAPWSVLRSVLDSHGLTAQVEVALIPGEEEPGAKEFGFARRPMRVIDGIAESLWLGEAMIEDRLVCYMQPVLDKRSKVFGYEAFARVETDKNPIGGGKIIEAGKGLSIEYMLDRHLHVKAISSFISSDLEGFLFINFVPGFIHRPEKYLEGLTDAARYHGMPAKQIVLDFTESETSHDMLQLKAIFDYCRSKGYSLSLDDIYSVAMAKKIFETVRPDFIKLDIGLVRNAMNATDQRTIADLVALAHTSGVTVLAEGVETEIIHQELLRAGVDLFQGYLFSPPVAVSAVKKVAGSQ